jgi:hypothetical protein
MSTNSAIDFLGSGGQALAGVADIDARSITFKITLGVAVRSDVPQGAV